MSKSKKDDCSDRRTKKDIKEILPMEFSSLPVMEMVSNSRICIDDCKGILEYTEYNIKMNTCKGVISINGGNLSIKFLSMTSVTVEGVISSVEFLNWR